MKFKCRLFGHDFDEHFEEVFHCAMTTTYHSDKCRRCGIDIHEVYEISEGGCIQGKKEKQK